MENLQVEKFDINSKYILIVKKELTKEERINILESLDHFIHDPSVQIMVIHGLDCQLEKV